jgi:apolipoprotein N-acyltransferase
MLPKWLCVSASAVLFSLAFIFPFCCALFVFLFLIPLMYVNSKEGLNWKDGFVWGALFFSIMLFPVTMIMYTRGHGAYRMAVSIALICASALWSTAWLLLVQLVNRWLPAYKEYTFIVLAGCYFLLVEQYLFWFFQPTLGYLLISPLIPLAHNPCWLQGAFLFSYQGTLFLVLLVNVSFFQMLSKKRTSHAVLTIALMMPFAWGWIEKDSVKIPELLTKIGYLPPVSYGTPADMAADIATQLERGVIKGKFSLIIMPESSFPYPLNEHDEAVSCWGHAQQYIPFIIGSHRKDTFLHNTLYCVQKGRIINSYDKKRLVPFTENVPEGKFFNVFKDLFLAGSESFSPGHKKKCECLVLEDGLVFKPLICSELFLSKLEHCEQHPKAFHICIANESWFSIGFQKELMIRAAKLQALRAGAAIIYVSHSLGLWITPEGTAYPLKSV